MLLLRSLMLGLFVAGMGSFFAVATAHQVEVRIPVWNVGNIISQVSGYVNGQGITKRKRTRPKKVLQKEEYWLPPNGYYAYYPHPLYPPLKRPTTKPTTEPPTERPTDLPSSESPPWSTNPTEETRSESSACQAAKETSDNRGLLNLDPANHQPKLSIVSKPLSLRSICDHFPQLCNKPEEAQFLKLSDPNGKPWLLISGIPEA